MQKVQRNMKRDAAQIEKYMGKYGFEDGAHFGFIVQNDGKRHMFCGGRCDLIGYCLSAAIAAIVQSTPELGEMFIDKIASYAKEIVAEHSEKKPSKPQ